MATIVDTLEEHGGFDTLVDALYSTGLDDMLSGGDYTLFAPTDAAFAKLPPGVQDGLNENPEMFREILLHHIAQGAYTTDRLMQNNAIDVLFGNQVSINATENLNVEIASFEETNIQADNGIIHAIDTVLQPATQAAGY